MFHTITIPATLYPAILQSTVERYEDAWPSKNWSNDELNDDRLQEMRHSRARLGELAAVLDQLSWTAIPREISITAEGHVMRSIISRAIDNTLMAFTRTLGATITPTCDLDHFDLMTDRIASLTALARHVQHDHDAPTAGQP